MKFILFALVGAALPLSGASAQTMNAQAFHQRAVALQKKGPLAVFSRGEIRALMSEGKAAGEKAGELRRAAVAAGLKPPYCPPTKSQGMGTQEFMKRLAAIPAAERSRINMTEALTRILADKYPCKG